MYALHPDVPEPLYAQLARQMRERVLAGRLAADERLPSVRALAAELGLGRNTVEAAYQELLAEGYIHTRPRSGYFVSALDQDALPPGRAPGKRPAQKPPEADGPGTADLPPARYDFHPARLDTAIFPAPLWRRYFLEILRESGRDLAAYGGMQGDLGLRARIRDYLEHSRGVVCSLDQVVVCAGLQHSLAVVADLLRETHSRAAVENPGYFLPRSVLANSGWDVVPVPVGEDGMDLEALRESGCRLAYVTPSHQFPLGRVMPVASRLKLLEWARAGGNVIFEDDYDSELRYQGTPVRSLQGLAPGADVVYAGTFSKILSPSLRLSYMVLPPSLLPAFRARFGDYQDSASLLEQRTLARFMERGHWERHIRRARTLCKRRHNALLAAVTRHFRPERPGEGAEVIGQGAGLHVVLALPRSAPPEAEVVRRAALAGIRLVPFAATLAEGTAHGDGRALLLLGFGALAPEALDEGVALLASLCRG